MNNCREDIINEYLSFLNNRQFPCIAAKAALKRNLLNCMVADHMACPHDDELILQFLYNFIEVYRSSTEGFHSAAIIFAGPECESEEKFDALLWQRLQSLADLDARNYAYDTRVTSDTSSDKFSFSIHEEAFYIIGLHPLSNRASRRFKYPAIVFNPHEQFEVLKKSKKYEAMKMSVRKRDEVYSGSVNPMLQDFGVASEVFQYSGRKYDKEWKCPLKLKHANTQNNTST